MIRYPVSKPWLGERSHTLLRQTLDQNQLTMGPGVEDFEQHFARVIRSRYAVATTSGTTALHLALVALGIGPGHEVIVPDISFVATANAVHYVGAKPIFVDIDRDTWCMDPEEVAKKMGRRTRAIIPVHLYGMPANMQALRQLALDAHSQVFLVEDAAEGLGGLTSDTNLLGSQSDAGVFSFYANKVMTTGEGGMIVTNDEVAATRMRFLRGQAHTSTRYFHSEIGFNYRMTDLQAAIGRGQLEDLGTMVLERQHIMLRYRNNLSQVASLRLPRVPKGASQAPWLFTLILPEGKRDKVTGYLIQQGIETRPAFVPMHRMPMYHGSDTSFPESTLLGTRGISLPTYVGLTLDQVDEICHHLVVALSHA